MSARIDPTAARTAGVAVDSAATICRLPRRRVSSACADLAARLRARGPNGTARRLQPRQLRAVLDKLTIVDNFYPADPLAQTRAGGCVSTISLWAEDRDALTHVNGDDAAAERAAYELDQLVGVLNDTKRVAQLLEIRLTQD